MVRLLESYFRYLTYIREPYIKKNDDICKILVEILKGDLDQDNDS